MQARIPEIHPISPTAADMMGCQAVANEATAAAPVIVVSVLAAESVCCIIYHKDSNYSTGGQIGLIQVNVFSSQDHKHPSFGYGVGGCQRQSASNVQLG